MSRALARREGPAQQQGQDQEQDGSNFGVGEEGVGSQWSYGSEMDPDQAQAHGGNQYAQSMLGEEEAPSSEAGDQEQGEGGKGGSGGGGGAPGGEPGEGDAQVDGDAQQMGAAEQQGEEAGLDEGGAEQAEGQGGQGASGGGGGGGAGGGGGGGEGGGAEAVGQQSPVSATRTPELGVSSAPTFSADVSEEASKAIKEHSGLDAEQHKAAAQGAVNTLNGELEASQSAQVEAANTAALEARSALEGEYFASIQGGFGTALSGITTAYSGAQEQVRAAAEGVKTGITTAATTARSDLATLATESVATLNTAVTEARTTLTTMEGEWMAPFNELEERRGGEFADAAGAAADTLKGNKETIASSFEGGSNPIEEAKGELKAKAARKIVDNDEQRIRSGGPPRAQQAITELDHAGIVGSFLAPLVAKVDAAATEGEGAITAAHDAAVAQIDVDVESSNAEVDAASEAACTQLEEDSTTSQGDAESATDQLESDLDTQMGDLEAQFTDTSADIADKYSELSDAWAGALETDQFIDKDSVDTWVSAQRAALEALDAETEGRITELRANTEQGVRDTLDVQVGELEAFGTEATTVAEGLAQEKIAGLEAIGTTFEESMGLLAEGVRGVVQQYTDPLGPDLEAYTAEVETELGTKLTESDTRLGTQLTTYQGELDTEIANYAQNINPGPVADGLEAKLGKICQDAWSAMRGWGTDEDKLFDALRQIETPAMGRAVEYYWPQVHRGASGNRATIRGFISDDCSSSEQAIAWAYLRGDRAAGARLEIEDNMNWYGDDEAQIEKILRSIDPEERTAMQALPEWESTRARIEYKLDGTDLDVTQALLVNNEARADAFRLRDSIDKARRKGDEDALHTALAGMDPGRREQIAQEFHHIQNGVEASAVDVEPIAQDQAYAELIEFSAGQREQYGYTKGASYNRETGMYESTVDGASGDLVEALITEGNDSLGADVARFEVERNRRGGPKEENMETALYMSAEDQAAIRDPNHPKHDEAVARQATRQADFEKAWQDQYGGQEGAPASVSDAIGEIYENEDNSAIEIEAHREMLAAGTNNEKVVALVSQLSVDGAGTDEERLKRVWTGLTPQEADEAQEIWQDRFAEGDETLHDRLFEGTFSEMSGDEAREQKIAMLGDSQYFTGEYADRHLQVADIEMDYTIGDNGGMMSGLAGDESESLRLNYQLLQEHLATVGGGDAGAAFDAEGNFVGTKAQYDRYVELCGIIGMNAANHRERIDSIASAITTGIAIVGAIAATILTAGTAAGPLLAAAAATFTAGAASMGANYALKGGRYGWEAAAVDLGVTLVSTATAGAAAYLGPAGKAAELAKGAQLQRAIMIAGGQGFVDNFASTAFNDKTWNNGFWEGMGTSTYAGLKGAGTGMISTGITDGIKMKWDLPDNGSPFMYGLRGSLSSAAGTAVGESSGIGSDALFLGKTMELDDAFAAVGQKTLIAAGQGGLNDGLEQYITLRKNAMTQVDQEAEEYNAAEEERAGQQEETDQELAEDITELNEEVIENASTNEEGEVETTVTTEEAQSELDNAEQEITKSDQDAVEEGQDQLEDVQEALDEVNEIDEQIEAELETIQTEDQTEVTGGDGEEQHTEQHTEQNQDGGEEQSTTPLTDDELKDAVPPEYLPTQQEEAQIKAFTDEERALYRSRVQNGEDPKFVLSDLRSGSDSGGDVMSDDALMDELIRLQQMGMSEDDVNFVMEGADGVERQERLKERQQNLLSEQSGNEHYPQELHDAQATTDPDERSALVEAVISQFDKDGQGTAVAALRALDGDVDAQLALAHNLSTLRGFIGRDPSSLSVAEIKSLCYAHYHLLNTFQLNESNLRKVIPMAVVESTLQMLNRDKQATNTAMTGGSVADGRNTEGGFTPEQIVSLLGLDYEGSPYLSKQNADGTYESVNELLFLQAPVTTQMQESAAIPLHGDIRAEMAKLATDDPIIAYMLTRTYDRNPGQWGDSLDPFTGYGVTAPGPRLPDGSTITLNQEMTMGGVTIPVGAQIYKKGPDGVDVLVATLVSRRDGQRYWKISADCPPDLLPGFQKLAAEGRSNSGDAMQ